MLCPPNAYPSTTAAAHFLFLPLSPHPPSPSSSPSHHVIRKIGRWEGSSLRGRVGVHLPLAAGHGDVDEAAGVEDALVGAALGRLLLLLGLDLLYHNAISICCIFHLPCCDEGSIGQRQELERGVVFFRRPPSRLFHSDDGIRTFGVCDLTLPARASEPCTLPMFAVVVQR